MVQNQVEQTGKWHGKRKKAVTPTALLDHSQSFKV
jgi:hypothetical protein